MHAVSRITRLSKRREAVQAGASCRCERHHLSITNDPRSCSSRLAPCPRQLATMRGSAVAVFWLSLLLIMSFAAASAQSSPPIGCLDDPTYSDFGWTCSSWVGYDCGASFATRPIVAASASASSQYSAAYSAGNAIDASSTSTPYYLSQFAVGNWLSVQIPADTHVGDVRVNNGFHFLPHSYTPLGTFEVWVASSSGSPSSSSDTRCGAVSYDASHEPEPYVLTCGGVSGSYVTIKQTGAAAYLALSEIEMFPAVERISLLLTSCPETCTDGASPLASSC